MDKNRKKLERLLSIKFCNVMLSELLNKIAASMLMLLIPLYVVEKGFSTSFAGLATTVYMLSAVCLRPFSGYLSDNYGHYPVYFLGGIIFLAASFFYSMNIPVEFFLIIRGIQGIGFAFYGTAIMTLATDIIPENRMAEGIGYLGLTQSVSRAIAPLLALNLVKWIGYGKTFFIIFILIAISILVGLPLSNGNGIQLRYTRSRDKKRQFQNIIRNLINKDVLKPSAIMLIFMAASISIQIFLVLHANEKGIAEPGLFFTVNAVSIAFARLFVGKISSSFGSKTVLISGFILATLSFLGIYTCGSLLILIISGLLFGFASGMIQPELNSLCVLLTEKVKRGGANSTFFMAMDLGQAVGAYLLGLISVRAGLGSVFVISAGLSCAALFLTFGLPKPNKN